MQTRLTRDCGWLTEKLLTGRFLTGKVLAGTVLTASFLIGSVSLQAADEAKEAPAEEKATETAKGEDYFELMRIFVDTFQEIDQNYVKEVDRRKLINAAVRGMLAELDPYSDYIAPDDLEHFTEAISQEFGGVGIRVNWDKQGRAIEILTPLPGSPAYKAGIKSGDRIVEIDDKPVKDFPLENEINTAVEMLRGKPGEKVVVGVQRPDSKDIVKIPLVREMIQLDTVMGDTYSPDGKWDLMVDKENKIGYLRLTHFTSRSASEVREALKSLKKQGMKGLILDLRYNPGGLLEAAVDIADMFVSEGLIVSTDGRNSAHRTWSAKSFGTYTGFPVAVLINRYSASASEIVSACLQDHKRGTVFGERSWGKGSVQDVIDLEDGKSALKLTTASYHRPSGKNIHRFPNSKESDEWGVAPDEGHKIEFSIKDHQAYQEYRHLRDNPSSKGGTVEFDDRQFNAAKTFLLDEIKSAAATDKQKPVENEPEEKAAVKPESKEAAKLPQFHYFTVPRTRAG